MSGNKRWIPNDDILRLPSLKEIHGVTWSSHCVECTLLKTADKPKSNFTVNATMEEASCQVTLDTFFLHHEEVSYDRAYKFVKLGFSPQCLCTSHDCQDNEIRYPYFKQLYSVPKRLFYIQYVLGFLVLIINLVIVLVVFSSKALRCNASFILICSMSVSDVFVGIYTIGIAFFNPFKASTVTPTELMENDNAACPYLGFVFTTGQTTAVFTSLFLTVERYIAIIRCLRPRQKLGLRYSVGISLVIWVVGILYALLPIFGVNQLQYHKWFQCTMPFHKSSVMDDTSLVTLVIVIGFVMVYVASVALYLYIYFVFCKSTAHLAIRREARLAKRLSLVVGTNFFFFVVPTVLFLVYVYRFMDVLTDVGATFSSLQGFIIMGSWVPVTLLGVSSLLNPFMYAFRHQKFRVEIGKVCRRLDKYFGEVITQEEINSPHHHHHHQEMMLRKKEREDINEQRPHLMRRHDIEL
ncbi:hypothetical protein QZH41_005830 [Actinostola sp. cb2023]|nr:hypothetical protein QZH41_005830 [Actinostola sp. cb2023]